MNSTRLRLSQLQNSSSLTIVQAQPRLDEATYECALAGGPGDQAGANFAKVHQFQLRLLVPPRLAPFEFPGDAQVGMKVLLTCSALEGQQPISFVWLRDNQIIDSSPSQSSSSSLATASSSIQSSDANSGSSAGHSTSRQQLITTLGQLHQQQLADKFALSAHSTISLGEKSEYVLIGSGAQTGSKSAAPSKHYNGNQLGGGAGGSGHDDDDINELDDLMGLGAVKQTSSSSSSSKPPKSAASASSSSSSAAAATTMHLADSSIRIRQADDYSILSIEPLELKHSGRYTCSAQNEAARVSHSSQLIINGESLGQSSCLPLLYPAGLAPPERPGRGFLIKTNREAAAKSHRYKHKHTLFQFTSSL